MSKPNRQLSSQVCWKSLPTTVTTWPAFPLIPRDGRTLVTKALDSYTNCVPSLLKSSPSLLLTSSATAPATLDAGDRHEIELDVKYRTLAPLTATLPNLHCRPALLNPFPRTLTSVPPSTPPRTGHIAEITPSPYTCTPSVPL